jgi:hypothetical protein
MGLEFARQHMTHSASEERGAAVAGYIICREASGGYGLIIGRQQLYFETMAELDRFLETAAWLEPGAEQPSTPGEAAGLICPMDSQTGADGVRDFNTVLARLSSEHRAAFARERAICQAELSRYSEMLDA